MSKPVRSKPTVLIVSEDAAFTEQVKEWTSDEFRFAHARAKQAPKLVCFGPDVSRPKVQAVLTKHAGSRWIWAQEIWDVNVLRTLPRELLTGQFMEMHDSIAAEAQWSKFLASARPLRPSSEKLESLIAFIKSVGAANDIFALLGQLRKEMQSFKVAGDPILLLSKPEAVSQIYYFRGKEAILRAVTTVPTPSARVRIHDPMDRQFLANQLGRPFGKVIAFPLAQERSSGWNIYPCIFFEHQTDDHALDPLIDRIGQRLQAVSLALDRLVLEAELKRTSAVWENTFDGIEEPIAIVDLDGEVVRANQAFEEKKLTGRETGNIKAKNILFYVQRYEIRIKDQGPVLSTVVHYHDITQAMNLRERMIQLEKMSAIGHLAGHIAHELNNPLTGIRSLSQILLQDTPESRLKNDLSEVEKAAFRCQEIILNLLDFSKGTLDEKTVICDLNEIVAKTLPFLKSAMGRLSSHVELSEAPIWVEAEPHLMQQVVFNLVNNACQALNGKGEVIVKTAIQNRVAHLIVKDSGPGVPAELQKVIFDPFFTTKKEGQGTGLGLSFSRDFVRRLGGDIVCESKPGDGAVFRVGLPLAREAHEEVSGEAS